MVGGFIEHTALCQEEGVQVFIPDLIINFAIYTISCPMSTNVILIITLWTHSRVQSFNVQN